ncbi:AraC-type DNA-binding protein [Ruminococcaceae bacterium YRB3002]|nr:AraC-type DNA-binding protein [Ruminococcaceae bacterium YRB3002]
MLNDLNSLIENGILKSSGAIPVVFEGIEHVLEKTTPMSEASVHDTHELCYVREGEVQIRVEGKKFTLRKGDTIIIRPNMVHSLKVTSKHADTLHLYFGFVPEAFDGAAETGTDKGGKKNKGGVQAGPTVPLPKLAQTSLESFMQFATEGEEESKDPCVVVSGRYKHIVASISERIIEEKTDSTGQSAELMLKLLTVELMIILSRTMQGEWEESLRVKNGKAKELVLIAKDYMDANYDRGITIADAAQYVFLSQGYFTRAFKEEIGMSPMNYLMNVRINRACELLRNDDIKVSAIATAVGFSSAQRFNVAFKKHTGLTPVEYRRNRNKKESGNT